MDNIHDGVTQTPEAQTGRSKDRFPILCVMQLFPIDCSGKVLREEVIEVVGRDLSKAGISFSHAEPIPYPRGVLVFNHQELGSFIVEVEVAWTKLLSTGLRETGCRLIRKLTAHELQLLALN